MNKLQKKQAKIEREMVRNLFKEWDMGKTTEFQENNFFLKNIAYSYYKYGEKNISKKQKKAFEKAAKKAAKAEKKYKK